MITSIGLRQSVNAAIHKIMPYGFGNILFMIAGVIGIATKKGYSYGFEAWNSQEYFCNPLPSLDQPVLKPFIVPSNYKNYDIGFLGFNIPDNVAIHGYLGSEKYFKHCEDLIRYYFTLKEIPVDDEYKDCIIVQYRDYPSFATGFARLDWNNYYKQALKQFPDREIVVVTDNVKKAKEVIKLDCKYIHKTPIHDFYILSRAKYLIMANSTFSWWGAWLSRAQTVAPLNWYAGDWSDCPKKDLYCKEWRLI